MGWFTDRLRHIAKNEADIYERDLLDSADKIDTGTTALRAIVARSNNDPLGTSKVNDMRRIAEDALRTIGEA